MTAKVGVVNLGCAKNLVDTEIMMGLLGQAGFQLVSETDDADVVLVNTCGFLVSAQQESARQILELAQGGTRKIVMAGCMVQRHREEVLEALPEVSAAIGSGDLKSIVRVVERVLDGERFTEIAEKPIYAYDEVLPRLQSGLGPSAYLKISEGCDHRCSFCIIPQLRGGHRSRPIETIVEEAKALVAGGTREVVLIAQDSTRYGLDRYGKAALPELLEALNAVEGLVWIRLHYAYPMYVNDALFSALRSLPKVLPYIDIPLQHSHPDVLRRMHRPTNESIEDLVARMRSGVPNLVLRTSMIVGFPGETDEEFAHLMDFVRAQRLDHVGVFVFSPEEGTTAYPLKGRVPKKVANHRRSALMALQQSVSQSIHDQLVGTELDMLVEAVETKTGILIGRTYRDAPDVDGTTFARCDDPAVEPGDLVRVRITEAKPYDLHGEVTRVLLPA
ncbi:MAG: 30S ribosomal protein S12 methylthiotransferase RimO [Candidatus Sericytochromatia bacterium]|nr:30S ribosomal protein S12 methylthiotransferase RimO [Candidatus Sericytochromatia bacterium]